MNNLLKTEFYKLKHSFSFWCLILFSFILGSLLLMDSIRLTDNLWNASLYNSPLLYFLIIVFAALFIGEDFGNRTLHSFISAGHKRSTILFAKTISYLTAGTAVLVVPLVIHGAADIIITGKNMYLQRHFLTDLPIIFTAVLAMAMLPLLCAIVFKDIGRTMAVPMMLYFLTIFALNSSYAGRITLLFPMGQLRLLSLNELPVSGLAVIGIDIIWIVILYICAYIGFYRADLT